MFAFKVPLVTAYRADFVLLIMNKDTDYCLEKMVKLKIDVHQQFGPASYSEKLSVHSEMCHMKDLQFVL